MPAVQRKSTKPYCTCTGGSKGWSKPPGPDQYWIHADCRKVSKPVWDLYGGVPLHLFP